jgi:NAD(P)-dependent dehydrogenase (short-subunit alcohol dehydrogenase family)
MTPLPPLPAFFDFSGQVVWVTGSSQGIGAGIARRFAQAGAKVALHYHRHQAGAEALAETLRGGGLGVAVVQGDLSQGSDVAAALAQIEAALGPVGVLVNNAGNYPLSSLLEMSEEEWDNVLNSNLRSTYLCTQAVARRMVAAGQGGAIVNISSIEGRHPADYHSHYTAAKAAVSMFTRTAAAELGRYGIRVNSVAPGLIDREGLSQAWPEGVAGYQKAAALGRLGTDEDVADACLFLASAAARWITGAELLVDGGVLSSRIF